VYKAAPGTEIMTTQHNMPLEDIQAALNAVLLRNGSTPITGNWNMGSNRITFLADGAVDTDAANVGQLKALLNNTALTGVTTVPAVTDWTAYQPVGAKDADARYPILNGGNTFTGAQNITGALNITGTITGLVASSTQKVTLRRGKGFAGVNSYDGSNWHYLYINDDDTATTAKGTLAFANAAQTFTEAQTFEGETLVPDVTEFDGKDALNAKTAEGRYANILAGVPIGCPLPWPTDNPPTGWLALNGASFDTNQYPALAAVFTSGVLPDMRGKFIRGWDNGAGVDPNDGQTAPGDARGLLTTQQDALQNITGIIGGSIANISTASGAFALQGGTGHIPQTWNGGADWWSADFDASRVARTSTESRPVNMTWNFIVRAA
jgi:hypothetical protein